LARNIPYPGSAALLPVIGTSLVILGRTGIVNDLLSWSPFVFVGKISYSWYLIHWPMLSFARIICNGDASLVARVAIACISFVCAVASYFCVEQPFRWSTMPTSTVLWRYGTVALAMTLPPFVFFWTQGIAHYDRVIRNIDMASRNLGQDKCLLQSPESHPHLNAICVPPGTNSALAVVGDSHAAALAGALRIVGKGFNYRIEELTKGFCTPAGGIWRPDNPDFARECAQFDEEVFDRLGRDSNVRVVVLAAYWPLLMKAGFASSTESCNAENDRCGASIQSQRAEMLSERLSTVIDRLEGMGKTVYVVQDNPEFAFDPLGIMRTRFIQRRQVLASLLTGAPPLYPDGIAPEADIPDHREAWKTIHLAALAHPATREIDSPSKLCISGGCRFATGDEVLYIDNNHLSLVGAESTLAELRLP
jgi:SGNH domain (fused to AT3 domains)